MSLSNMAVWDVVPWTIVALWLVYVTLLARGLMRRQILSAADQIAVPRSLPRVTILVAARNEESCIERCLRSLAVQDYPNLEIIAINDRSTDATGEIMDRLEAEFLGQLRVVHLDSLPAGWFGKTHALHIGSQSASGDWLCHIDADCELQFPGAIRLAVAEAERRGIELLSLIPRFELSTAWEQMTVPICSSLMLAWFQPELVNDPRLSTSYANGAFLLITRHCLDAIGGWRQFRSQISEDIALARAVKASGYRLAVLENDGLYRATMYATIRESWNGWSRIFYGALRHWMLLVSTARLVVCSILPTWSVLMWLTALSTGYSLPAQWHGAITACCLAVLLQQVYCALVSRLVGSNVWWSLTAPFGHLVLLGMMGRALLNHVGLATTSWSGAVFRNGQPVNVLRSPLALPDHVTQAR